MTMAEYANYEPDELADTLRECVIVLRGAQPYLALPGQRHLLEAAAKRVERALSARVGEAG